MDFTVNNTPDKAAIKVTGQFTFADSHKFKSLVESALTNGIKSVNLDFEQVTFIDSAGLGMLLRDECGNRNIPITITAAQGQVERIFMISKFDQLFSMPN